MSEAIGPRTGAMDEWRRSWIVVVAAALGYGTGGAMLLLTAGLFIAPMRDTLGWTTSAVTIAPIITLLWALCYPLSGAVIDRVGGRRVAIGGTIALAITLALVAALPLSPALYYGFAAVLGVCASLTAVPTYALSVAGWFRRGTGLAIGIAMSGSAIVAIAATPLTGTMIAEHGWRAGYWTLAGIVALVGLPAILLGYREPPRKPNAKAARTTAVDGRSFGEAARDSRFWAYLVGFALACVPLGGIVGHLQPLLAGRGFPLAEALSLGVLYAIAISVGKISAGFLLDRLWSFGVVAAISVAAGIGALALGRIEVTTAMPLMMLIIFSIGLGQGAEADFVAFFAAKSFGLRAYSTIVGVLAMMSTLGLAVGGWLFAVLADRDGGYATACAIGAGCLCASAIVILAAGIGERRRGDARVA